MKSEQNKKIINSNELEPKEWDSHDELKLKEIIIQCQNDIEAQLKEKCKGCEPALTELITGMIEVADVILKNTSGIGSNFKLAECDLTLITKDNIRRFFSHVLSVLAYHFGQLVPAENNEVWETILSLLDDPSVGQTWIEKLTNCLDHKTHEYSPVRGGRLLWQETAELFAIKDWDKNTTARIYYQTAPAQDLIYIMESIENERWATI